MTQAEPRTIEEIVLPLATRMVPCPQHYFANPVHDAEGHYTTCPGWCRGTGQVVEFPGLRRHWEEPHTHVAVFDPYARYDHSKSIILDSEHPDIVAECEANRRRGWLPVTTERALLEAIWSTGAYISLWLTDGVEICHPTFGYSQGSGHGAIALALALEAARK